MKTLLAVLAVFCLGEYYRFGGCNWLFSRVLIVTYTKFYLYTPRQLFPCYNIASMCTNTILECEN